jgi:hypothetical protein
MCGMKVPKRLPPDVGGIFCLGAPMQSKREECIMANNENDNEKNRTENTPTEKDATASKKPRHIDGVKIID